MIYYKTAKRKKKKNYTRLYSIKEYTFFFSLFASGKSCIQYLLPTYLFLGKRVISKKVYLGPQMMAKWLAGCGVFLTWKICGAHIPISNNRTVYSFSFIININCYIYSCNLVGSITEAGLACLIMKIVMVARSIHRKWPMAIHHNR